MPSVRIVVDTNVFIGAFFRHEDDCLEVLRREHRGELTFVMSEEMTGEILGTVYAVAVEQGCSLEEFRTPFMHLGRALRRAEVCQPQSITHRSPHEKDNKFIDCAKQAGVDYIVACDHDLLDIKYEIRNKNKQAISIIRPADFLKCHDRIRLKDAMENRRPR